MRENAIKLSIAGIGGIAADWLGQVAPMIFMVIGAVLLDYITGMLAAVYNEGLSSRKGRRGLVKKVSFLLMLGLGFLLDAAIPYFAEHGLSATISVPLPFGLMICAWIVITEAISVLENLCRIDGIHVPGWLVKMLESTKDGVDG
ncbi:MAG: phage holin family protein [Oscillospiraceae bacterium]|nr:phage holin family protein [Oscillospiraceae bacterium]